jgi:hypothetical protein
MTGRVNEFECPTCQEPLNEADRAWVQQIINVARARGSLELTDTPRELSCGHKATVESADWLSGSGFWLVAR